MASRNGHRVQAITIIIGMPASGKSTLMKHLMELTSPWRFDNTTKYLPMHFNSYRQSVILGRYDDSKHPFPGTDRMSMACQAHALTFIKNNPDKDFIMEGDRLGNQKFILSLCNHTDAHITVIHLVNGAQTAVARMRSSQTDTFRRSRKTKLDNIDRLCVALADSQIKAPSIDYHVMQNDSAGECHTIVTQLLDKRSLDSPAPDQGGDLMNISEEAIQLLAAYKHEIAQWRMQKPLHEGDWWVAHDSYREPSAVIGFKTTYVHERFKTEDECKTWVQLRSLTVALHSIRACAS